MCELVVEKAAVARKNDMCLRDREGRDRSGLTPRLLEPGNETGTEGGT